MRIETQRGPLISQDCPARLWQSWHQNFACGPLPHVRGLGLRGDLCKYRLWLTWRPRPRPSSAGREALIIAQHHWTVWGKWEGLTPPTAVPETRLLVPPPPNSPGGWEVSSEVSEKRRGRQTAEQSQISSHGHLPAACGEGVHLAPRLATGHSAGWTLR